MVTTNYISATRPRHLIIGLEWDHTRKSNNVTFQANVSSLEESHTYSEASQRNEWIHAMNQELAALEANETYL